MNYKLNLITPSLYSKSGSSNCQDVIVEKFAHHLKYRSDTEFNLKCKYDPVPGLAFIHSFEDFEEKFLIHSEYAIIIASPASQLALNQFIPRLLVFLTSKPIWQNRFIFVILGKVKVMSNLVVNEPIEFSVDNWENNDEKSWISLFDLIKVEWQPHEIQLVSDSSPYNKLHATENGTNDSMLHNSHISEYENNKNSSFNSSQDVKTTNTPDLVSVIQHKPLEFEDNSHSKTVSETMTTKSQVKNLANRSIQGSNVVLEYLTFSKADNDNTANPKVFTESYSNTEESRFTYIHESNENQLKQEIEQNEENTNESSQMSNNDSDSYSEQSFECAPGNVIESIEENEEERSDNEMHMNRIFQQHQKTAEDPVSDILSTKSVRTKGGYIYSSLAEIKSDENEVSIENIISNPDQISNISVSSTVSVYPFEGDSKTLITSDGNSVQVNSDKNIILSLKKDTGYTKDKDIKQMFGLNVSDAETENREIPPNNLTNILEKMSSNEVSSENKINSDKISQVTKVNEKGLEGAENNSNELLKKRITDSCLLTSRVSDFQETGTPDEISEENINSAISRNELQINHKGTDEKENTLNEISSDTIKDKCLPIPDDFSLKEKEFLYVSSDEIPDSSEDNNMSKVNEKEEKENTSNGISVNSIKVKCLPTPDDSCLEEAEYSGANFEDNDLLHKNKKTTERKESLSNEISTIKDTCLAISNDSCEENKEFFEMSFEDNTSSASESSKTQTNVKDKGKESDISNETSVDSMKVKCLSTSSDSCLKDKKLLDISSEEISDSSEDNNMSQVNEKDSEEKGNTSNGISANSIKVKCLPTPDDSCLEEAEYSEANVEDNDLLYKNKKTTERKERMSNEISTIKDTCLAISSDSCLEDKEFLEMSYEGNTCSASDSNKTQTNVKDKGKESDISNETSVDSMKVKCLSTSSDSCFKEKNLDISSEEIPESSEDNKSDSIINIHFNPMTISDFSKMEDEDTDIGSRINFSSVDINTNVSGNRNQYPVPQRREFENIEEENTDEIVLPTANSDLFYFKNAEVERKTLDEIVGNEDSDITSIVGTEDKQAVEQHVKMVVMTNQGKMTKWTDSDQNFEINDKVFEAPNSYQKTPTTKHSNTKREHQTHFNCTSHIPFGLLSKLGTIGTFIKRVVLRQSRNSSNCHKEENSNLKEDSITRCLHSPWCVMLVFVAGTLASPYWVELTKMISQRAVEPDFLVDTISSTALHEEKIIGKYNHYF